MEPLIAGAETVSNNSPEALEFRELKKRFPGRETLSELVKDFGIVYVTSITRRGCSGCGTQKPLFRVLAGKMVSDYAGKVHFTNVHVQYGEDEKEESWESKRIFRHAAYPTYMIHVRSKAGPLEVFRGLSFHGRVGETGQRDLRACRLLQERSRDKSRDEELART
jgi:hypothetical protein